jgi:hypothetical protein
VTRTRFKGKGGVPTSLGVRLPEGGERPNFRAPRGTELAKDRSPARFFLSFFSSSVMTMSSFMPAARQAPSLQAWQALRVSLVTAHRAALVQEYFCFRATARRKKARPGKRRANS